MSCPVLRVGTVLSAGAGESLPVLVKAVEVDGGQATGGEGTADAVVASFLEPLGGKVIIAVVEGNQGNVSGVTVCLIVLQLVGLAVA